jgi:plasmid stabilization system protein ParE
MSERGRGKRRRRAAALRAGQRYRVERATDVDRDLALIFDFLFETHRSFGYSAAEANDLAADRVRHIEQALEALAKAPHQGTEQRDLVPGLRMVTKDRAIFYFVTDAHARTLRVLAVFFGGQDYQRRMLRRLLTRGE